MVISIPKMIPERALCSAKPEEGEKIGEDIKDLCGRRPGPCSRGLSTMQSEIAPPIMQYAGHRIQDASAGISSTKGL